MSQYITRPLVAMVMVFAGLLIIILVFSQIAGIPIFASDSANLVSASQNLSYNFIIIAMIVFIGILGMILERGK